MRKMYSEEQVRAIAQSVAPEIVEKNYMFTTFASVEIEDDEHLVTIEVNEGIPEGYVADMIYGVVIEDTATGFTAYIDMKSWDEVKVSEENNTWSTCSLDSFTNNNQKIIVSFIDAGGTHFDDEDSCNVYVRLIPENVAWNREQ